MDSLFNRFQRLLQKSNAPDTRDISLKAIETLVKENRSGGDLKVYLKCLQDSQKASYSFKHKQVEILAIGYIGQVYGQTLLLPPDSHLLYSAFQFL